MPAFRARPAAECLDIIGWLAARVAKEQRLPAADAGTMAALAQADGLTGLSQITGVLRQLALSPSDISATIRAFQRPGKDSQTDPRLTGWA